MISVNWDLVGFVKRSKNRQKVLDLLETPLTPSDIAKKLEISLTHASKIVRELNSKKLIKCLNENLVMGRIYQRMKDAKKIIDYLSKTKEI